MHNAFGRLRAQSSEQPLEQTLLRPQNASFNKLRHNFAITTEGTYTSGNYRLTSEPTIRSMNYASLLLLAVSSFLLLYFIWNECVRFRRRIGGIPGPPGLPIVGNLFQVYSPLTLSHSRLGMPQRHIANGLYYMAPLSKLC